MITEVKIPSPGESVTEVEIAEWLVSDGDIVQKDQQIAEIESEKATLSITAEDSGKVNIKVSANETVKVGDIACTIDNSYSPEKKEEKTQEEGKQKKEEKSMDESEKEKNTKEASENKKTETPADKSGENDKNDIKISPLAKKLMDENGLSIDDVISGLARISKADVEQVVSSLHDSQQKPEHRDEKREKMSSLRRKLSERLVSVKNETATLTTFNEVDMSSIIEIRNKNKQAFIDKYGIKPGFMSFFTKAAAIALGNFNNVNAYIDGNEIVYHNYSDIGIAVQTPKGLMVPVLKDADKKDIPTLEKEIKELADKAKNKKISLDELKGGTFSITNGGVFGSLLSTPIINPPQAAILGMHSIQERPVAIKGQVEIRPMMYIALSYDHRLIDGKESVTFLKIIKDILEEPGRFFTNGKPGDKEILVL